MDTLFLENVEKALADGFRTTVVGLNLIFQNLKGPHLETENSVIIVQREERKKRLPAPTKGSRRLHLVYVEYMITMQTITSIIHTLEKGADVGSGHEIGSEANSIVHNDEKRYHEPARSQPEGAETLIQLVDLPRLAGHLTNLD